MKHSILFKAILALSLFFSPLNAIAHVGHGDEFEATGGINKVKINADTDSLLGIQVTPIEAAAENKILIPFTALVEDNGRQVVFVQYENFYEPVDVTVGETSGEQIEIIEGLSVGELLVSQGSLSLYAESRKSQSAEEPSAAEKETKTEASSTADRQTEAEPSTSESKIATDSSNDFPVGAVVAVIAGLGVIGAGGLFLKGQKK